MSVTNSLFWSISGDVVLQHLCGPKKQLSLLNQIIIDLRSHISLFIDFPLCSILELLGFKKVIGPYKAAGLVYVVIKSYRLSVQFGINKMSVSIWTWLRVCTLLSWYHRCLKYDRPHTGPSGDNFVMGLIGILTHREFLQPQCPR